MGQPLYSGRTMGLPSGEVVDGDGKLVAYSTSRMRIFGEAAAGAPARGGTAEVLGADGRPVALATGSAALLGT